jgi:alkaline phosphatase D
MKKQIIYFLFLFAIGIGGVSSQQTKLTDYSRSLNKSGALSFDPKLKPFYHGVASGDPLNDRVIIWTRITPDSGNFTPKTVSWKVATDTSFLNIVQSGSIVADSSKDYTVKIDVTGLQSGATYYYVFGYNGYYSVIGRMRTAATVANHLRFAVVSCNNYEAGFFNGFKKISQRNDLDAIIHLGDYIYEYEPKAYGDSLTNRFVEPKKEIISEGDYRTRYSVYRLDADLRAAHQQQTFISIWDDHESSNDSYENGAENHQTNEGDWQTRKNISKKVYFEWMPIRETTDKKIYRKIMYGNLVDLFLLDTRLEGRVKPPVNFDDADIPARTMLGSTQFNWFINQLSTSTAKWKVIGNQVLFSDMNVGFGAVDAQGQPAITNLAAIRAVENLFIDNWESYPTERNAILDTIQNKNIKNTIFLTGDSHASWSFDLNKKPVKYPDPMLLNLPSPSSTYTPATGAGSVGVEFATPSITSANFDEAVGAAATAQFEAVINNPLPIPGLGTVTYNPHLKYVDLDRHGYFILDLKNDSAQADYFYLDTIRVSSNNEKFNKGVATASNSNRITSVGTNPASPKSEQEIPAPVNPPTKITGLSPLSKIEAVVIMAYPNPTSQEFTINYALNKNAQTEVQIFDIRGINIKTTKLGKQPNGIYSTTIDVSQLPVGFYYYHFIANSEIVSYGKFLKQ